MLKRKVKSNWKNTDISASAANSFICVFALDDTSQLNNQFSKKHNKKHLKHRMKFKKPNKIKNTHTVMIQYLWQKSTSGCITSRCTYMPIRLITVKLMCWGIWCLEWYDSKLCYLWCLFHIQWWRNWAYTVCSGIYESKGQDIDSNMDTYSQCKTHQRQ